MRPTPPDVVVFAETTEEVAGIVKACARRHVPVIPFGAGTSLEGHVAALHGGVCIDLGAMVQVVAVNPEDMDATVQAGVTRTQLNTYLRDTGLFFPHRPGGGSLHRRHDRDPGLGHQRGALRHHARECAGAHRGARRRARHPHQPPGPQVLGGL